MALTLNLSAVERNDSRLITFTDTTTGWGEGTDPDVTDIEALSEEGYALVMDIVINSTTDTVTYDTIDLGDEFGPFATQDDMVFALDASMLLVSDVALGSSDTLLPDGVWDITYRVLYYTGGEWTTLATKEVSFLIYGQVKTEVYDKLRLVPRWTESDVSKYRDIQEAGYYYTYLQSIEKSAFIARKTELIQMLETLERLLINGSNYPW